jgi:hypothetical protein
MPEMDTSLQEGLHRNRGTRRRGPFFDLLLNHIPAFLIPERASRAPPSTLAGSITYKHFYGKLLVTARGDGTTRTTIEQPKPQ